MTFLNGLRFRKASRPRRFSYRLTSWSSQCFRNDMVCPSIKDWQGFKRLWKTALLSLHQWKSIILENGDSDFHSNQSIKTCFHAVKETALFLQEYLDGKVFAALSSSTASKRSRGGDSVWTSLCLRRHSNPRGEGSLLFLESVPRYNQLRTRLGVSCTQLLALSTSHQVSQPHYLPKMICEWQAWKNYQLF